jgi:succinylglutamic semialdehyde dehydrogenase
MNSLLIDNAWVAGRGAAFASIDPSTGEAVWQGRAASRDDVAAAVAAARRAFPGWARRASDERIAVARRFAELLTAEKETLARAIGQETGKPLWEARTEVATMAAKVEVSVQAYHERTGTRRQGMADGEAVVRHRPHGVVAVFGPYNFPGHLPNGHIVPALIAGNTVVFKPSELAPLVAQQTLALWLRAGLDAGVLNLVQGERDTGMALAAHPGIDGLFFTGSSATGAALHRQFAGRPGAILALEMGGNNPLVVAQLDALDAAVHHAIQSAFLSAGQRCTCARRILVPDDAFGRRFARRFTEVAARLTIGRFDAEPQPFMGPVVSRQAAARLVDAQALLLARGGRAMLTLTQADPALGFVTPGVIDVTDADAIPDEEFFGPLVQLQRYRSFDEALVLANRTAYGLSAALLADDPALWQRFSLEIRAGVVNWNRPTNGASSAAPFGGIGRSGNHRASAWYAADYCAWPMASVESAALTLPAALSPGFSLDDEQA